jgi:nucleoid DNA-binding protein
MSKLAEFRDAEKALAMQVAAVEQLRNDPELKRELEFNSALDTLLAQFKISRARLYTMLASEIAPDAAPAEKKSHQKGAGSFQLSKRRSPVFIPKVYRNPHTGEEITVKLRNHSGYKAWVAEHGKVAVESWRVA